MVSQNSLLSCFVIYLQLICKSAVEVSHNYLSRGAWHTPINKAPAKFIDQIYSYCCQHSNKLLLLKIFEKDSQSSSVNAKNLIGLPRYRDFIMSLYGVTDRLYSFNYSAEVFVRLYSPVQRIDKVGLQPAIVSQV